MKTDQTIQLLDGRKLGYARYGKPSRLPIFYFTGGNSSRLEGMWFEEVAQRRRKPTAPDWTAMPGNGVCMCIPGDLN